MAASVREAAITQGEHMPGAVAIEQLPFMRVRLPLCAPGLTGSLDRKRAGDRTVHLAGRWKILSDDLPKIRAQTVTCLQATEGKNGALVLKIADRPKFDALKKSIADYEEHIANTEDAIRELDGMHAGFLSEMQDTRSSLEAVEAQQQQLLSSHAAAALQRGARLRQSPEKVLEADQLYQDKKATIERQIATAKQNLAKLAPEIAKIESILAGVGC
jgi:hypothetical protein